MEKPQAGFRDFIRAFGDHWFNYMSGSLSVPAAMLALYVESPVAKLALWLTAAACIVLAAYLVWRTERLKVIQLEERLNGNLELLFEPKIPWVAKIENSNLVISPGNLIQGPSIWFLVQLYNPKSSTVAHGCRAYIRDIQFRDLPDKNFESTVFGSSQSLRWSKIMDDTAAFGPRDVGHSERCLVDVLSIDPYHNRIFIKWKGDWLENKGLLDRIGEYRLTIAASSDDSGEAHIVLLVKWSGKWDEVTVTAEHN